VGPHWLIDSASEWMRLDESKYSIDRNKMISVNKEKESGANREYEDNHLKMNSPPAMKKLSNPVRE
jgi:hypothetical protein